MKMMKNITKPNSLKKEKFNPQTLKPGTTFDDVTRNFLIEESKIRNLESDEIQYLMTDEQYRNKKPVKTQTQKPFKKIVYTTPVKIDPTPIALRPPMINDQVAEEQTQRFNNLLREVEQEKLKTRSKGLAGLLGIDN